MRLNHSSKLTFSGGKHPARLLLVLCLTALVLMLRNHPWLDVDFIGWTSGFTHPLTGWDHLLTMLAVGIWAAQLRGHAIWLLPLAFVSVMSLGGLAGAAGVNLPSVEGLILVSCGVFSVLIIRRTRFSTQVNVMIVAFFAFFHGFAHGQEISASASLISYTLGFMLATLLLHGAGIVVAKLVVIVVSCLISILFANLAQANQGDVEIADAKYNVTKLENSGNPRTSPHQALLRQQGYDPAPGSITEIRGYPENTTGYRLEPGSYSAPASPPPDNNFQNIKARINPNQLGQTKFSLSSAFTISKYPVNAASEPVQTAHPLCKVENQCLTNLNFKHYYPDINHTPGKDLHSNGVGLTSPPDSCFDVIAPKYPQLSRTPPVLSFEAFCLQISPAKHLVGNLFVNNASRSYRSYPAVPYHCDTKLDFSKPHKIGNSSVATLGNLYFHPHGSGIDPFSRLKMLSVFTKQSRQEIATRPPFFTTKPSIIF